MSTPVLKFDSLQKSFGYQKAVKSAVGVFSENNYISLFGANGAGKSTLLYLLSGVYKPDGGKIEYVNRTKKDFHLSMQLMSHHSMFYGRMSAENNLEFFQNLYEKASRDDILFALEYTGLIGHRHKFIDGFSRGMIQRLMIARLVLAKPDYVFFDEPFTGLDVQGQKLLLSVIKHRGIPELKWVIKGFIFVDHDVQRSYELSDTIWLMQAGILDKPLEKNEIRLNDLLEILT